MVIYPLKLILSHNNNYAKFIYPFNDGKVPLKEDKMNKKFEKFLKGKNMSINTIDAYCYAIESFENRYKSYTKDNLLTFKGYLIETYKPKTVNLRIQAINKYLEFIEKNELKLSAVKIQQKPFLENVISDADYTFFKIL